MAITGPTVAQAKLASPESLWHFLAAVPSTIEFQILIGLMLAGTFGMVAHYTVKWFKGEIAGSLFEYLFVQNFRGTVLSMFSFIGLALTSIITGVFEATGGVFVGWTTVLWFGLTQGFAVDAIANKGDRKEWTDQERAVKAVVGALDGGGKVMP